MAVARDGKKPWTSAGVKGGRFAHAAQEVTLVDYIHKVYHAAERIARTRCCDCGCASVYACGY